MKDDIGKGSLHFVVTFCKSLQNTFVQLVTLWCLFHAEKKTLLGWFNCKKLTMKKLDFFVRGIMIIHTYKVYV